MRTLGRIALSLLVNTITIMACHVIINYYIVEISILETILINFLFGMSTKLHNFILYPKRRNTL